MEDAKRKIREYTEAYLQVCKEEMTDFVKQTRAKVELNANKFGEAKHTDIGLRVLFEVPETLFSILKSRLTEEEFQWYGSKDGSRWFVKAFPIFKVTEKV